MNFFAGGYGGQLSLGQAVIYAAGAYGSAVLSMRLGRPVYLSIPGGIIMSMAAGLLVALPAGRIRDFYLGMVTLGFGVVAYEILQDWEPGVSVAGGPVEALRDVSLQVARGSITAIIGANGAGKSTCLKAVSGIVSIGRGDILFEGRSIAALPAEMRPGLGIAHVLEGRRLFSELSVEENLQLGAYARHRQRGRTAEIGRERDALYERFPVLAARRAQVAGTMSGGEQQMLAIGAALMATPKLLRLDEPSLGLAPKFVERVAELIRVLRAEGLTILLVEQQASMAISLADTACLFERGRVRAAGSEQAMFADQQIRSAYFGSAAAAQPLRETT